VHEQVWAKNAGQLIRLGRRKQGVSRNSLADFLAVSEVHVSKMEQGLYFLNAEQWIGISQLLKIPSDAIKQGYVDRMVDAKLTHQKEIGDFRIPERYANSQASTVRAMLPLIEFMKRMLGEEDFHNFLRFREIEPEFFFDLSHQLNVNFPLDILRAMIQKQLLNKDNVRFLTHPVNQPKMHGVLGTTYHQTESIPDLLEQLLMHMDKYEINCEYSFSDLASDRLDISVIHKEHLKDFQYKDEILNKIICVYKLNYLRSFITYQNVDCANGTPIKTAKISELECHFEGSDKCVYRVSI